MMDFSLEKNFRLTCIAPDKILSFIGMTTEPRRSGEIAGQPDVAATGFELFHFIIYPKDGTTNYGKTFVFGLVFGERVK